jgi:hypothetical protein
MRQLQLMGLMGWGMAAMAANLANLAGWDAGMGLGQLPESV